MLSGIRSFSNYKCSWLGESFTGVSLFEELIYGLDSSLLVLIVYGLS